MDDGANMKNGTHMEEITGMDRRDFLKTAGLGAAAAGTALAAGCRKPVQHILPYGKRPEDVIPGKPTFYATGMSVGAQVNALLVESHDGRPTKIEGNPQHPFSNGASSAWAQASVLDLYDADRSREASQGGQAKTVEELNAALATRTASLKSNGGKGLALLSEWIPSPAYAAALAGLKSALPNAKIFLHDPMVSVGAQRGAALVNAQNISSTLRLEKAKVILSLDADFLNTEGNTVLNTKGFSAGRQADEGKESMNRLYAVEPRYTLTGTSSDHRLQIRGDQVGEFLASLTRKLEEKGLKSPQGADLPVSKLDAGKNADRAAKWLDALADDLIANKGKSLVIIGDRQPEHVHALGHLINTMLDAGGNTITYAKNLTLPNDGDAGDLAAEMEAGNVETLIILGANPVYTVAGDVGFAEKMAKVKESIHLGHTRDETGQLTTWHIPMSHYLESWGDLQSSDGTTLIQQPLIAPLFASKSALEIVLALSGSEKAAHEYVKSSWTEKTPDGAPSAALQEKKKAAEAAKTALTGAESEKAAVEKAMTANAGGESGTNSLAAASAKVTRATAAVKAADAALAASEEAEAKLLAAAAEQRATSWNRWIQRGVIETPTAAPQVAFAWEKLAGAWSKRSAGADNGYELNFVMDSNVGDGRFSNNAWLQEMPDPITKISWDNAACIGKGAARDLNITTGDMIRIESNGNTLELAACLTHGVAEKTVILPLGYGRQNSGKYADGTGFNTYNLKSGASLIQSGATVTKVNGKYTLAITQVEKGDHSEEIQTRVDGLIRENTIDEFVKQPDFVKKYEVMPKEKLKSLFTEPNVRDGQQWGMAIDLSSCTGCNACAVACQSENNVSIVGKKEVANGREMHWLRMDRYFDGPEDNPDSASQPLGCAHCENAPCETVCPVAATVHGPEGTNDIAYNRCIGTRYCANNCPYKVRRFNYYNFSKRMDDDFGPLLAMQRNPDVTVRFRGVIEKCSYCVQRITEAHIDSKVSGDKDGVVKDGMVQPACGQACAAGAITFGDINNPESAVSKKKASQRNYSLLAELNIHPRTTYLARIRNPNPALEEG